MQLSLDMFDDDSNISEYERYVEKRGYSVKINYVDFKTKKSFFENLDNAKEEYDNTDLTDNVVSVELIADSFLINSEFIKSKKYQEIYRELEKTTRLLYWKINQ